MTIVVCPLSKVEQSVAQHQPELVLSLLDPEVDSPLLPARYKGRHLRLTLHDVLMPYAGLVAPARKHIEQLLGFIDRWQADAPLLVHCHAGISRSTASAFIAACYKNPNADERRIASELRRASPSARPNEYLVELADSVMQRSGRMTEAVLATSGAETHPPPEATPFSFPSRYPSER